MFHALHDGLMQAYKLDIFEQIQYYINSFESFMTIEIIFP